MARLQISGDQGIAYGALQAGVAVATSYPGSPSSSTIEFLRAFVESHGLHVEWSTNEKVAFETAVGASIGGVPALMGCKGVGFNVALDPVMVANLTDVGAGAGHTSRRRPGGLGLTERPGYPSDRVGIGIAHAGTGDPLRRDDDDAGGLPALP